MNATPADAATVMLLRPCRDADDIEVLLVRRHRGSRFVPGYHVYPGGVVEPEDLGPGIERFCRGIDRQQAAEILPDTALPDQALGAWVAGIRETFEEVGMLIAHKRDGSCVTIETEAEKTRFCGYRRALAKGEMGFIQVLEQEHLVLPLRGLTYSARWITPEPLPLRYDVRFFLAAAPAQQVVICDGAEVTDHLWVTPSRALAAYEEGRIGLVLPQIMTLRDISRFHDVEDAVAAAKERRVPAILTRIRRIDGADVEVMPDGAVCAGRTPVYPRLRPGRT